MALRMTIKLLNGIIVENAYIRIDTISGYKGCITINVNSYMGQDAFETGSGYLEQKNFNFIPSVSTSATDFITQGYEYLKMLPEFTGAEDC